jgi:hypothetical protein
LVQVIHHALDAEPWLDELPTATAQPFTQRRVLRELEQAFA